MELTSKNGIGDSAPPGNGRAPGADPLLVEAATKSVIDIIEKAKEEASKRESKAAADSGAEVRKTARGIGGALPWHSRARGLLTRLLSSFCFRAASARSEIPKTS